MDEIEARSKAGGAAAAAVAAGASRSTSRTASPARRSSSHPSPHPPAPAAGSVAPQPDTTVSNGRHPEASLRSAVALGAVPGVAAATAAQVTANGHSAAGESFYTDLVAPQPAAATPAAQPRVPAPQTPGQSVRSSPPASVSSVETGTADRFEAARRRLYSADGVPAFLTAAADELRARHPGVPFLDHAWGQARCAVLLLKSCE